MFKKWYLYLFIGAVVLGAFLYFRRPCFGYQCQYNIMNELTFGVTEFNNLDKEAVVEQAKNNELILLDVREVFEYDEERIPGAKNFPLSLLSENIDPELSKDVPILIYCRSGNRSGRALEVMKQMGFKHVYDLKGGIINWENNNLPVLEKY